MFQKLKKKLVEHRDFKTYLKYAVGEIILIVIGILIAVSINNWNRDRQQANLKSGILNIVANDLQSDTTEVGRIIRFYEQRESMFERIANTKLTINEVDTCKVCRHIITSRRLMSLNTRGYQQLQDFQTVSSHKVDSLTSEIVNFYSTTSRTIESINEMINDDITTNLQYLRDRYDWYSNYIFDQPIGKEGLEYFARSQDYKNRVAYHYIIVYNNYLPLLKYFKLEATKLLIEIEGNSA